MTDFHQPGRTLRTAINRRTDKANAGHRHTFWFTGDGARLEFAPPYGWSVCAVFADGVRLRPAPNGSVSIIDDGFAQLVRFSVPPGSVDIAIDAEREGG